jgi:dTDP-glucose 4,6-dehydratase
MGQTKLLITGSGGCFGSNFIRYILKNYSDYKIASIDYCTYPNVANTIYSNKGHSFHVGNVSDEHLLDVVFQIEKPDIVIHSLKTGLPEIHKMCLKHKCRLFIVQQYEGLFVPENSVLIRAAQYFGPKQQKHNLVPQIIDGVLNNKPIPIEGMRIQDWLHVQDACAAVIKILKVGQDNDVYDISAKIEITDIEMFQEICNVFGRGHDLIQSKESVYRWPRLVLDNKKIKELGWEPLFKFKSGLIHTVNWYQNNQWFLKDR